MGSTIDFDKLSVEQKADLRRQLEAEDKAFREKTKQQRADYLSLKDSEVKETFKALEGISTNMELAKKGIWDRFETLLKMKQELYGLTDKQIELQQSHTFTTIDNDKSIIIGSNVIDGWTDDVNVGVDGVNEWIETLTDEKAKTAIRVLLKTDKNGVLKASRILELSKKAEEIGDKKLLQHIAFIQEQYRPKKNSTFIKAKYLDEHGVWQWLALSMSAV